MAEAHAAERGYQVRSRTAAWALEKAYMAAPLVLRLAIGTMLLAHGLQKLMGTSAAAAGFEAMGFTPGMLWMIPVALAEAVGGAAILLGFFTRFFAFVNLIVQLVGMLLVHLPNGFFLASQPGQGNGIEFTLVNSGILLALVILGAGSISVDHLIHRRDNRLETRRTEQPVPTATPGTTTTAEREPPSTPPGTRV